MRAGNGTVPLLTIRKLNGSQQMVNTITTVTIILIIWNGKKSTRRG